MCGCAALAQNPEETRVLVVGGGDPALVRMVADMGVEAVDVVEPDALLCSVARSYFGLDEAVVNMHAVQVGKWEPTELYDVVLVCAGAEVC